MDWQKHRLIVMGVVALLMVGATWWALDSRTGDTEVSEENAAPTLPEIERDDLTDVEIRLPGNEEENLEAVTIHLVKDGETWRLSEPVEAPASATAVSTVLDKIASLELIGRAARSAQHHERLEVAESNGIRVTARAGSETAIDFWVGAYQSGNTMLRIEGEDEVLMVRGSIKFAFNKRPRDWRDRTISELTVAEVHEVEFSNENGHWTFQKGEGDDAVWAQQIPEPAEGEEPVAPIEEFQEARVTTMVSSLARLRAAGFAEPDVDAAAAGFGEGAAMVRLVSGTGDDAETLILRVGNEAAEGQRYVQRDGDETIFLVSRFMAERLLPNTEGFQPGAEPEAPPTPPPGMGMPGMPGMPGGGGPGGGQIPPELMQQIQRQLQAQGQGGPPGH